MRIRQTTYDLNFDEPGFINVEVAGESGDSGIDGFVIYWFRIISKLYVNSCAAGKGRMKQGMQL